MFNNLPIITSEEELENLIDESEETLYVRWSHGPEADAKNDWTSKNWAGTWDEERGDYDYIPVDEDGLSATWLSDTNAVNHWKGECYGKVCYVLTGREIARCSDDEPLLIHVTPIAIVEIA